MMVNKVYDDTFISESLVYWCTYLIELYIQFILEFREGGGVVTYLNIFDIFDSSYKHVWKPWGDVKENALRSYRFYVYSVIWSDFKSYNSLNCTQFKRLIWFL